MKIKNSQLENIKNDVLYINNIRKEKLSTCGNPNYKIDVLLDDKTFVLNTLDDYAMNYKIDTSIIGKSFNIEYVEINGEYYILKML